MGRVLAFDYGTRRVGVAVSDPLKMIANSLETQDTKNIFDFARKYCVAEEVECMVVGFPFNHGHHQNDVVKHIETFIAKLQTMFPDKKIYKVDERFTSKIASRTLHQSGVSRTEKHNKKNIDAISANLILQSYLENPMLFKS